MDKEDFLKAPWIQRAMDPGTPTTESNQTVFSSSFDLEDGTIVLVPTIRMIEGKLVEVEDPVGEAMKRGDFLKGFKDHDEATKFSKMISQLINAERKKVKRIK